MERLIPIGRFSKICRLSISALRYYDEVGLLRPAAVDPDSSYRYYRLVQVRDAERIRLLRSLDLPLDDIRLFLHHPDLALGHEVLDRHQRRMEERVADGMRILSYLRQMQGNGKESVTADGTVRRVPHQHVLGVERCVPETEVPGVLREAWALLLTAVLRTGAEQRGPVGAEFPDFVHNEDAVSMIVFVPVTQAVRGHGAVRHLELPSVRAASITHVGPYVLLNRSYRALVQWTERQGYELAGPPREIYRIGPLDEANPTDYQTDLLWPIR
ncbi:MAG: MerR family transcriptional regulator [Chloroflexia bacterium]|nr:MerR family transcriptional regulator [Chloroflexia bacterium]